MSKKNKQQWISFTEKGIRYMECKICQSEYVPCDEDIVAVLTGNLLKDTDYTVNYHQNSLYQEATYRNELLGKKDKIRSTFANGPIKVRADKEAILKVLGL